MQKTVSFPERLVLRRNRMGWTQPELAERSGVSVRSISDYERGLASPVVEQLQKLACALDVSIDWLMGGVSGVSRDFSSLREEEETPYDVKQSRTLDLSSIPRTALDSLFRSLSDELAKAEEPQREKILLSLTAVHQEIQRRSNPLKGGKSPLTPDDLSPELKETAEAMESVAHQSALRAARGSKQSSPTGETNDRKSPGDHGNKPPKPGAPGQSKDESGDQSKAHK